MPLNSCGSVRARLSVWFSRCRRSRKAARSASMVSRPPLSKARRAASPRTTCSDARRFVPASVKASEPELNSQDRQRDATRRLGTSFEPAQTARDHEVQHEKQIILQRNDDALAQSPHGDHAEAFDRGERRFCGAQQKRIEQADVLEALADDARRPGARRRPRRRAIRACRLRLRRRRRRRGCRRRAGTRADGCASPTPGTRSRR